MGFQESWQTADKQKWWADLETCSQRFCLRTWSSVPSIWRVHVFLERFRYYTLYSSDHESRFLTAYSIARAVVENKVAGLLTCIFLWWFAQLLGLWMEKFYLLDLHHLRVLLEGHLHRNSLQPRPPPRRMLFHDLLLTLLLIKNPASSDWDPREQKVKSLKIQIQHYLLDLNQVILSTLNTWWELRYAENVVYKTVQVKIVVTKVVK